MELRNFSGVTCSRQANQLVKVGHEHRDSIAQSGEQSVDVAVDLGNLDVGVAVLCSESVRKASRLCSCLKDYKPRASPRATFFESMRQAISWQP